MSRTHTYTLAEMPLSRSSFHEIWDRLEEAGYEHAIHRDTGMLDMNGIGVTNRDKGFGRPDEPTTLQEVSTIYDKATAGKWSYNINKGVWSLHPNGYEYTIAYVHCTIGKYEREEENAEAICALHNAFPAMLEEIRRSRSLLKRALAHLEDQAEALSEPPYNSSNPSTHKLIGEIKEAIK